MATTIDRSDLVTRVADLRARRPSLALRAARGDDAARRELAAIDADARVDAAALPLTGAARRSLSYSRHRSDPRNRTYELRR